MSQTLQDADLQSVATSDAGRRLLVRIIEDVSGVHASSYAGENTHQAAYLEGKRSVGLELLTELKRVVGFGAFVRMLAETGAEQEAERIEAERREREKKSE